MYLQIDKYFICGKSLFSKKKKKNFDIECLCRLTKYE